MKAEKQILREKEDNERAMQRKEVAQQQAEYHEQLKGQSEKLKQDAINTKRQLQLQQQKASYEADKKVKSCNLNVLSTDYEESSRKNPRR